MVVVKYGLVFITELFLQILVQFVLGIVIRVRVSKSTCVTFCIWGDLRVILPSFEKLLVLLIGLRYFKPVLPAIPLKVVDPSKTSGRFSKDVRFVIKVSPLVYVLDPFFEPFPQP